MCELVKQNNLVEIVNKIDEIVRQHSSDGFVLSPYHTKLNAVEKLFAIK